MTISASLEVHQANGAGNGNSDAYFGTSIPSMSWGPHQGRIVRYSSSGYPGILIAYPFAMAGTNSGGAGIDYGVKILTLGAGSTHDNDNDWVVTAQIATQDDFFLLKDPSVTNRSFLIAWPNSIPTIYKSTDNFTGGQIIPGAWQDFSGTTGRHYCSAGISQTGQIVFKAVVGLSNAHNGTAETAIDYIVGSYDATANTFVWGSQQRILSGERYAYGRLFPRPRMDMPGIYEVARRDIFKTLSAYGLNDKTSNNYIFEGSAWRCYGDDSIALPFSQSTTALDDPAVYTRTGVPRFEMNDAIITKDSYTLEMDFLTDDGASFAYKSRGFYLTVRNKNGVVVQDKLFCTNIVTYGDGKFLQDSYGRLFYILASHGSTTCEVYLYTILRSGNSWVPQATPINLSSSLYPYAPESLSIRVAQESSGNALPAGYAIGESPDYKVKFDLIINCKYLQYDGGTYNSANAYVGGSGRILHGKLYVTTV